MDPAPHPKALGCSTERAEQDVHRLVAAVRMLLLSGSAAHPAQGRTPGAACCSRSSRRTWGARQRARGAVRGGPGHLAGPCEREFLSFILLINTIYFTVPGVAVALCAPVCRGGLCARGCRAWPLPPWGCPPFPGGGCPRRVGGGCRQEGSGRAAGRNVLAGTLFTSAEQLRPRTAGPLSVRRQGHVPSPARGCDVAVLSALAGWGLPALPQCGGTGRRLGPAFGSSALHRLSAPKKQPCVPQHSHPVAPQTLGATVYGAPVPFAAGGDGDGAFLPPLPVVCVFSVHGCLTPACAEGLV